MILVGKIKNIAKYNLNWLGWYAKLKKKKGCVVEQIDYFII